MILTIVTFRLCLKHDLKDPGCQPVNCTVTTGYQCVREVVAPYEVDVVEGAQTTTYACDVTYHSVQLQVRIAYVQFGYNIAAFVTYAFIYA